MITGVGTHAGLMTVLAMATLLGGCAAAPSLGLVSLAADGVSLALTGRSTAEQAWSLAREQACRLDPAAAKGGCGPDRSRRISARSETEARPPELSALAAVYRPDFLPRAAAATSQGAKRYLIAGSFASRRDAERLARALKPLPVAVAPYAHGGKRHFRVVIGPDHDRGADLDSKLASAGIADIRPITLCRQSLAAPPCRS